MKKLFTLLLVTTLFISCSSDDDSGDYIEPEIENNDKEIDELIKKDIDVIKPILNFGIQENELLQIISDNGYVETRYPFTEQEYFYGKSDTYGDNDQHIILPYGFAVERIKTSEDVAVYVAGGMITHIYLFENNDDADTYPDPDNKPYYQVQIMYNGTENTYDMVKEWILTLNEITSEFQPVSNLKDTKERIIEDDFTVEIGVMRNSEDDPITFARFYDNRTPVYAN